VMEPESRM